MQIGIERVVQIGFVLFERAEQFAKLLLPKRKAPRGTALEKASHAIHLELLVHQAWRHARACLNFRQATMQKALPFFFVLWVLAVPAGAEEQLFQQAERSFNQMIHAGMDNATGELIDAAEKDVKAALRADASPAECEAMLATVYGFELTRHSWKAVWLGPKIDKLYRSAMRKNPDSARIHYLAGTGFMNAPLRFRDLEEEKQILLRADELFAAAGDRIGGAKACLKLGDLMAEQNDSEAAKQYYLRALELQPDFAPAQRRLETQ